MDLVSILGAVAHVGGSSVIASAITIDHADRVTIAEAIVKSEGKVSLNPDGTLPLALVENIMQATFKGQGDWLAGKGAALIGKL